jgi:hydroxymethylpyrimidine pyrophosphatase-like HAD family hydrolase
MRLLALDIDDTLTGRDHRISEANVKAVAWAMSQGVRCTLVTGRRHALSAAVQADVLGISGPLGVHYGRRVVDHPSGRVLANHPLPEKPAKTLVELARTFPGAVISVFLGDDLRFDRFPEGVKTLPFAQVSEGGLDEALAASPEDVMSINIVMTAGAAPAVTGNEGLSPMRAVAEAAGRLFPDLLTCHYAAWAGDPDGLVTVVASSADKGTALLDIARRLGIDPADTVAMGDAVPDIPLLKAAGTGIAMPWSAEEVRRAADAVAEGDPEDAVAREIYRRLGRPEG